MLVRWEWPEREHADASIRLVLPGGIAADDQLRSVVEVVSSSGIAAEVPQRQVRDAGAGSVGTFVSRWAQDGVRTGMITWT